MKKLALLFLASAIAVSANAQTAVKENKGLIGKISATWCGPCGAWGWVLMNDLIAANPTAFPISIFPSSSDGSGGPSGGTWKNLEFYNADNVALANAITFNGYPSYSANTKDWSLKNTSSSGVNTAGIKTDVNAALAAYTASPVVASTGFTYKITGNTIEVKTSTKFWQAATGNYNIAVYLLEDAVHIQNAQTGAVSHHGVFRASFGTSGVFGEQIVAGSAAANQTFDKTFTYTLTGDGLTKWDKTKFHPVAIIYKQNGSAWEYVNGNNKFSYVWATSVENTVSMNSLAIYPNPATDKANVSVVLSAAAEANITVTDIMGRNVFTSGALQFEQGQNEFAIPTSNLSAGMYNVTIRANENILTQRVSVTK